MDSVVVNAGFYIDPEQVIRARSFDMFSWVRHGFGTSLSGGWPCGPIVTAKQIHSDHVLIADGQAEGAIGEGDALIASESGTLVAIRTADCIPIFVLDPVRRVVAAIHAGWRGTAAGISSHTVSKLSQVFGSKPSDLIAAIGPGIGECCFEVGPEVASQFQTQFPERGDLQSRTHINLAEANRRQLSGMGMLTERILDSGECTCCGIEQYHSYRRDRDTSGRMTAAIGILG